MKQYKLEVLVSKQPSHRALLIRAVNLKLKSVGGCNNEAGCLIGNSLMLTNR